MTRWIFQTLKNTRIQPSTSTIFQEGLKGEELSKK